MFLFAHSKPRKVPTLSRRTYTGVGLTRCDGLEERLRPYLEEVDVVLRQSQLVQSGTPLSQLTDLLLQLLQDTLSSVLGCPPAHLDHLGNRHCGPCG